MVRTSGVSISMVMRITCEILYIEGNNVSHSCPYRVATGQGKVREMQGRGSLELIRAKSGNFILAGTKMTAF